MCLDIHSMLSSHHPIKLRNFDFIPKKNSKKQVSDKK